MTTPTVMTTELEDSGAPGRANAAPAGPSKPAAATSAKAEPERREGGPRIAQSGAIVTERTPE